MAVRAVHVPQAVEDNIYGKLTSYVYKCTWVTHSISFLICITSCSIEKKINPKFHVLSGKKIVTLFFL